MLRILSAMIWIRRPILSVLSNYKFTKFCKYLLTKLFLVQFLFSVFSCSFRAYDLYVLFAFRLYSNGNSLLYKE